MNGHAGADRPFSQRMGIEQKKEIQIDSMDDELRNRIWNVMDEFYFTGSCFHKDYHIKASRPDKLISEQDIIRRVFGGCCINHFYTQLLIFLDYLSLRITGTPPRSASGNYAGTAAA